MGHRRTKQKVFGRQLLIICVETLGWPVAHRPRCRASAGRRRTSGFAAIESRASQDCSIAAPGRTARHEPSADQARAIIVARIERRWGPHRLAPLTGHSRSTVCAALRRAGLSRLRDADRPTGIPVRYVACHPGTLLHQDSVGGLSHNDFIMAARIDRLAGG